MIDPDSYLKRKRSATRGEIKQREALKEKLKDIEIIMTGESLKGIKRKRNELALQADKDLEDEIKLMGSEWVEPKKRAMEDFPKNLKTIDIRPEEYKKFKYTGTRKTKEQLLKWELQDYPSGTYFRGYEHLLEEDTLYIFMAAKDVKDYITKDIPEPQFLTFIKDL